MSIGRSVTPAELTSMMEHARQSSAPWIEFNAGQVERDYNRRSFVVPHRLQEHPLFQMPALQALCRRMGEEQVHFRFGKVDVDSDFDQSLHTNKTGLTLENAITRLEEMRAYVAIYNPEKDPEYRSAIEELIGEIGLQIRNIDPGLNWYSTYIFLSAQGSVTPYHMDREMNFLLQIRGKKTVRLWDPFDPEVMSPEQKDALLAYSGKRPTYRPSFENKASIYELAPGMGVHHPFIAPHLVTTGPEPSITLALTFRSAQSDVWSDAHRANHWLRRLGWHPKPVYGNPRLDRRKARLVRTLKNIKQLVRH